MLLREQKKSQNIKLLRMEFNIFETPKCMFLMLCELILNNFKVLTEGVELY